MPTRNKRYTPPDRAARQMKGFARKLREAAATAPTGTCESCQDPMVPLRRVQLQNGSMATVCDRCAPDVQETPTTRPSRAARRQHVFQPRKGVR